MLEEPPPPDTRQLLQTQTLVLIVTRGHPMEKFF